MVKPGDPPPQGNETVAGCGCLIWLVISAFTAWHHSQYNPLPYFPNRNTVGDRGIEWIIYIGSGVLWPFYWLGQLLSIQL